MKYIDTEKLIAEVERLSAEHTSRWETDEVAIVLDKLEDFIISLQQEQTEVNLEKELKNKRPILVDLFGPMNGEQSLAIKNVARHFYELGLRAKKEK